MWVIVKLIPNIDNGVKMPVLILNQDHEIWEFEKEEDAIKMKNIFMENSDSNYEYIVKKI